MLFCFFLYILSVTKCKSSLFPLIDKISARFFFFYQVVFLLLSAFSVEYCYLCGVY